MSRKAVERFPARGGSIVIRFLSHQLLVGLIAARLAVVFVLLLCLWAGAYAQDQTLGIGARGGVNFATQSGGTGDGWTSSGLTTLLPIERGGFVR